MNSRVAQNKSIAPSPRRRVMIYSWIGLLVGGQLFATAVGQELWPFSPYPMYARIRYTGEKLWELEVRQVFVDGTERTMHNASMRTRARRLGQQKATQEQWRIFLKDIWFPYRSPEHSDRQAGLIGLRIFRHEYDNKAETFDPDKPNRSRWIASIMPGRIKPTTMPTTQTQVTQTQVVVDPASSVPHRSSPPIQSP